VRTGQGYVSRFILRDTHQNAMPATDTRIPRTPITNTAVWKNLRGRWTA
jgi:hypothetical protein